MQVAPGSRLGPYEIVAPIGAGGMGTVWRARDTRLDRDVALKVVRPDLLEDDVARRRFRKEALALAKLQHAHIAYILDVVTEGGVDALVMELVPGVSLSERLAKGPLGEAEAVRLGIQLADALAAAGAQGVVHCDLKPANLRVTPEGDLKVLDFGLARLRRPAEAGDLTAAATESATALEAVGTLPYMAPEQLRAEPVDARTDVWGAGAVLCELATGRRPFEESVPAKLTDAILHAEPPALSSPASSLSSDLQKILRKCLQKEAARRYESAVQLRADLDSLSKKSADAPAGASAPVPAPGPAFAPAWPRRRIAVTGGLLVLAAVAFGSLWRSRIFQRSAAGTRIDSLAVLPLSNLSRNPEQEYFSDGMTEALIAELSKIRALKVISRTSVMQYKNATKPLPEIAKALGVKGVVEGSVMREGESVRITVQLIDADTDRHLWAESYTRDLKNVLSLQSEVASAIARAVRVAVTPEETRRLSARRTVDPEAHRLVLLGQQAVRASASRDSFETAAGYYRRAIEKDPDDASAHLSLGGALFSIGGFGWQPVKTACGAARAEAEKAAALDPDSGEVLGFRAYLRYFCDRDTPGAVEGLRRALDLAPGSAVLHDQLAWILSGAGRHDEALAESAIAVELDPLHDQLTVHRGMYFGQARRHADAERQFRNVLSTTPDSSFAKFALGQELVAQGRYDEALAALLSRKVPRPEMNFLVGLAQGLAGRTEEARKVLDFLLERRKTQFVPPAMIAMVYLGLGNKDRTFEWLDAACDEHGIFTDQLKVHPMFDLLRSDPRFDALLKKMSAPA